MDIKELDAKIADLRGRLNQKASSGTAERGDLNRMNNRLSQLTSRKHAAVMEQNQAGMIYHGSAVKGGGAHPHHAPGAKHEGVKAQDHAGKAKHHAAPAGAKHNGKAKANHVGGGKAKNKAKANRVRAAGAQGGKAKNKAKANHVGGGKAKNKAKANRVRAAGLKHKGKAKANHA